MLTRIWWLTVLRGILGVVIGVLLLVWPGEGAEALIMLVGAFAVVAGIFGIVGAAGAGDHLRGFGMASGIVTLTLGLIALLWPGLTANVLVYIVAVWALLFGLVEIAAGVSMPVPGSIKALTTGIGLISVVLALLLLMVPEAGVVVASWLIGLYLLLTGALTIYHAIELRRG
ncbi:MAG: HdeD family acid-resistance protein, partial [Armatimonadota bacterium]